MADEVAVRANSLEPYILYIKKEEPLNGLWVNEMSSHIVEKTKGMVQSSDTVDGGITIGK